MCLVLRGDRDQALGKAMLHRLFESWRRLSYTWSRPIGLPQSSSRPYSYALINWVLPWFCLLRATLLHIIPFPILYTQPNSFPSRTQRLIVHDKVSVPRSCYEWFIVPYWLIFLAWGQAGMKKLFLCTTPGRVCFSQLYDSKCALDALFALRQGTCYNYISFDSI